MNRSVANGGQVPLTALFRALGDQHRRYLLYYLVEYDPAEFDDLVTQICAWDFDIPDDDVADEQSQPIQVELYHNHLPSLSDAGIIEYDQRSGVVRFQYQPEIVKRILSIAKKYELE